jgi:hypothetical protein
MSEDVQRAPAVGKSRCYYTEATGKILSVENPMFTAHVQKSQKLVRASGGFGLC